MQSLVVKEKENICTVAITVISVTKGNKTRKCFIICNSVKMAEER